MTTAALDFEPAGSDYADHNAANPDAANPDAANPDAANPDPAGHPAAHSVGGPAGPRRYSVLDSGSVARADLVRPVAELARRAAPALPVLPALRPLLPEGLRRGSTVTVADSVSLLLALLGGPSGQGAWCALVGLPPISAEAATGYGIDLSRLAIVPAPGASWLMAVGALLEAVDVVAVRPPTRVTDGELRRLGARVRERGAVLVPYLGGRARWPRADVELSSSAHRWDGLGAGHGRLHGRRMHLTATGRGQAARPRSTTCWLPSASGGMSACEPEKRELGQWTA